MTPNRWRIPVGAVAVHLCIGNAPWWFSPPYTTFTTALVLLGLSAAFGGPWVERRGARAAAAASALFFWLGLSFGGGCLALETSGFVFFVIGGGCGGRVRARLISAA